MRRVAARVAAAQKPMIMKRYLCVLVVLLLAGIYACKKDKTFKTFPPPAWSADTTGTYPLSMTAVLRLPDNLQANLRAGDELGAFIGEECRGRGVVVQAGGDPVFFVLIRGTASETGMVSFRYYASGSRYIYRTGDVMAFAVDGNYGTVDGPVVLRGLKPED